MALLALGGFKFKLKTAPFKTKQTEKSANFAKNSRVGQRSAYQFLGVDNEKITLSGKLLPPLTGGKKDLLKLEKMMETGESYTLVDGNGFVIGSFIINSISNTDDLFFKDGMPRKTQFTLKLTRVDDDRIDLIG